MADTSCQGAITWQGPLGSLKDKWVPMLLSWGTLLCPYTPHWCQQRLADPETQLPALGPPHSCDRGHGGALAGD